MANEAEALYFGNTYVDIIKGSVGSQNGVRVFGGPTDPISDLPVYIDFAHHQVHEGEMFQAFSEQLSLGAGTVKFAIDVPTGMTYSPHMQISCDSYGGGALLRLYSGSTYTGGSTITGYNKARYSTALPDTVIMSGVTSTDGTQIDAFLAGSGKSTGGSGRSENEWILNQDTNYRVDVIGLDSGTKAIVRFEWYEDQGV